MTIASILIEVAVRFGQILAAPLRHPDMLWIIIPIYLAWLTGDYFQERKVTDFGNAMTNAVVILWVGLDWARQTIKTAALNATLAAKILICIVFVIYGLIVIIETAKSKPIAHLIGRAREIGYFCVVATPIFYDMIPIDMITIAAILLFFPIVYGVNELWDRLLPAPPGEEETLGPVSSDLKMPDMGAGAGMPEMPAGGGMPPMGGMPKF
jgi:hypothetical protein